jgi:putative CRISPR-associated protein (TIGR02619 family)
MEEKVFIFTVGTSLQSSLGYNVKDDKFKDVAELCKKKPYEFKRVLEPYYDPLKYSFKPEADELDVPHIILKAVEYLKIKGGLLDPKDNIYKRELFLKEPVDKNKDSLSAEMSTIYLYYKDYLDNSVNLKEKTYFYFLGSDTPDGCFCATVLNDYFNDPLYLKDFLDIKSEKFQVKGLDSNNKDAFLQDGVSALFTNIKKLIERHKKAKQIYLVVSGGFKAVCIFATLFGGIFPKTKLLYVYEYTPDLIEMEVPPINFDILTWRDYRAIFKLLDLYGKDNILNDSDILPLIDSLPAKIKSLLNDHERASISLNPIGRFLKESYEDPNERKKLTQYGEGLQLLELLDKEEYKNYLKERINTWQYLWIGDKIPEMAEHQRGHTQRLQELAYPVLKSLKDRDILTEYDIITMILAIWLHDLGNSGDYFKLYPEFFKEDNKEKDNFYIKGFPTLVREFHNFMSYTLMDCEGEMSEFLYGKEKEIKIPRECIHGARIIGLYHRKAMPFPGGKEEYKILGKDILKIIFTPEKVFKRAIKNNKLNKEIANQIDVNLLTALFRIIDASDTQLERSVDKEYIDTRKSLIELEKKALLKKIALMDRSFNISDAVPSLKKEVLFDTVFDEAHDIFNEESEIFRYIDRYSFIGSQPPHYSKHQILSTVLILKSTESLQNKTIFNHISIYSKEETPDENKIEDLIRKDFISEYKSAMRVLEEKGIKFKFWWYSEKDSTSKEVIL